MRSQKYKSFHEEPLLGTTLLILYLTKTFQGSITYSALKIYLATSANLCCKILQAQSPFSFAHGTPIPFHTMCLQSPIAIRLESLIYFYIALY